MFVSHSEEFDDLAASCDQLEESMIRMSMVQWGCTIGKQLEMLSEREKEDDRPLGNLDNLFNHSWRPIGPSKGWYWIPKGRLSMDIVYPARLVDIRRFGYQTKKIRATPLPPPLSSSFAAVTQNSMAHREISRQTGKRRQENWRYEDWMDEDDLLGGELREQDLQHQL